MKAGQDVPNFMRFLSLLHVASRQWGVCQSGNYWDPQENFKDDAFQIN
jgi:hypothetical protein